MKTFHLEILSPERSFYRGACVSLIVPISDGMIGIQAGRAPLTAASSSPTRCRRSTALCATRFSRR